MKCWRVALAALAVGCSAARLLLPQRTGFQIHRVRPINISAAADPQISRTAGGSLIPPLQRHHDRSVPRFIG